MSQFLAGERVVLACDNPFLDGRPAVVLTLTDYGAVVSTGVGSGQWRALPSELAPRREPLTAARPQQSGFTGDSCGTCGSFAVVRTGTCATCQDCGHSVGGCV